MLLTVTYFTVTYFTLQVRGVKFRGSIQPMYTRCDALETAQSRVSALRCVHQKQKHPSDNACCWCLTSATSTWSSLQTWEPPAHARFSYLSNICLSKCNSVLHCLVAKLKLSNLLEASWPCPVRSTKDWHGQGTTAHLYISIDTLSLSEK